MRIISRTPRSNRAFARRQALLSVRRSRLLEVGLFPDPVVQVAVHLADVVPGRSGVPTAGEPAAGAARGIPCDVWAAALHVVQPALVPLEAGPPDGIGGVGVHCGRLVDPRPGGPLVWIAVLEDAVALGALPGPAVVAQTVAGGAGGPVPGPVALGRLPPPALDRRLCSDQVLVDPPLARGPAQDLLGRAGERAVDPCRQPGGSGVGCARVEEAGAKAVAGRLVGSPVHSLALR